MSRDDMRATTLISSLSLQDQRTMTPRRERGIDQLALGQKYGEIDSCAGGEQIADECPQSVRHFLPASHTGNGRNRDIQRGRGLVDCAHQ